MSSKLLRPLLRMNRCASVCAAMQPNLIANTKNLNLSSYAFASKQFTRNFWNQRSLCTDNKTDSVAQAGTDNGCFILIRGVSFSARKEQVESFLEGVDIIGGRDGIRTTKLPGTYVFRAHENSLKTVLALHKKYIQDRYVEVFHIANELLPVTKFGKVVLKLCYLPEIMDKTAFEDKFLAALEKCGLNVPNGADGFVYHDKVVYINADPKQQYQGIDLRNKLLSLNDLQDVVSPEFRVYFEFADECNVRHFLRTKFLRTKDD